MQSQAFGKLNEFVEAAKSKGASDEFLCTLLIRQGWPANEVYETLGQYWQVLTGISIPARSGSGESARDAFLYLLSFSTLATWATSLGGAIFDLINYWVPDLITHALVPDLRTALTWELARIAVAFPIYLFVTAFTVKEAAQHPDRLQSGVRKWLTYIALLGTAGTMICDLIWFLDYLLTGEITLRFILKSATVMIICGGIFAYYLSSLRWTRAASVAGARMRNRTFALGSTIAVIVAFCVGLSVAGTPTQQRTLEADRTRIENLHTIALAVKIWHNRAMLQDPKATVPPNLEVLMQENALQMSVTADPLTHARYDYHLKGGNRYELCADFSSSNVEPHVPMMHSQFWQYGKGKTCFVLDASSEVPW